MTNHEFENYFALVSRLMRLNRPQEKWIRDELHDHLETRIDELVQAGTDPNEATRQALEEFGDAASLAQKFQTVFQQNQRRWMMRFAAFSIAGSFLFVILVMAMWPSDARFGAPEQGIAQETTSATSTAGPVAGMGDRVVEGQIQTSANLDRILQSPFSGDYDEVEFIDVMDELRENYGINVLLDQSAEDDSLTEDESITFRIKNTKLSTALRLMLRRKNATYVNQEGILRIISLDVASDPEFFRRQIFDCRALLEKIAATDQTVGTVVDLNSQLRNLKANRHLSGRGSEGGGLFQMSDLLGGDGGGMQPNPISVQQALGGGNPPPAQPQAAHQRLPQKQEVKAQDVLQDLIKNTIDPDGWEETNGDGSLMVVSGLLVVTQTEKTLDEIESLIEELEKRIVIDDEN